MKIGITLTSSLGVGQEYVQLTEHVGRRLAERQFGLVYGGTAYGMMKTLGESYTSAGGHDLTGVMAKDLMRVTKGYAAYEKLDTSFLEDTIEDRKRRIIELADAFLILPGGYGTLEEIGAIVGGKANKLFDKPIAFYNYHGFYDTFLQFLEEIHTKQFSKLAFGELLLATEDLDEIIAYYIGYRPTELADKFVS